MSDPIDTAAIRAKAKMWHLPAGIADDILALCDALDEARAENERARHFESKWCNLAHEHHRRAERWQAALEDIADGMGETDLRKVGRYAKAIARAALAAGGQNEGDA